MTTWIIEGILRDMHNDLMQRVESREMVQTAQAKHDELQRAIHRLQAQLDTLQQRITAKNSALPPPQSLR